MLTRRVLMRERKMFVVGPDAISNPSILPLIDLSVIRLSNVLLIVVK
jgi:hypothetical protein